MISYTDNEIQTQDARLTTQDNSVSCTLPPERCTLNFYGPGIDEPILMINISGGNETVYYYHFDGLGSVVGLSNSSGSIVERYSYDVFGEPNRVSSLGNSYLFTGRQYDSETENYYYRARYYKPSIGRFLQTDKIGYADGLNMYSYCGNNPISWADPYGLCKDRSYWWSGDFLYALSDFGPQMRDALGAGVAFTTNGLTFHQIDSWNAYADYLKGRYGAAGTASENFGSFSMLLTGGAVGLEVLGLDVVVLGGTTGAAASNPTVQEGMQLWRAWGGSSGPLSPGNSTYWTNVNPQTISNFSQAAQLPIGNTGQFISTGTLTNTANVIIQQVPNGTVYEVIVPNGQVLVNSVSGGALP